MARAATTYGTAEAAKKLGVSKPTLLRWFAQKRIGEVRRDHNNWRVFTERDLRADQKRGHGQWRQQRGGVNTDRERRTCAAVARFLGGRFLLWCRRHDARSDRCRRLCHRGDRQGCALRADLCREQCQYLRRLQPRAFSALRHLSAAAGLSGRTAARAVSAS